jgi:hypothetical protein
MKIAENIVIKDELKIDFTLDYFGNPTGETYSYKEYHIVDKDGDVLEIGRYTQETITIQEILDMTGIKFGVSGWFV